MLGRASGSRQGCEMENQEGTGESEKDPEDYAGYLDYDPEADRGDE